MRATEQVEWGDVQGLVKRGYGDLPVSAFVLLRVTDRAAAQRWLGDVVERLVTPAAGSGADRPHRCNVAFTRSGLEALGVGREEILTFSPAFREGMAAGHRARALGDVAESDPAGWAWGGPTGAPVDVLLLLYAADDGALAALLDEERARASGLAEVAEPVTCPPLTRTADGTVLEHFGFADGISQPVIAGTERARRTPGGDVVAPGEVLLGYRDGSGRVPPAPGGNPATKALGRNGTYLVCRQLAQDVAGFWQLLDAGTRRADGSSDPRARVALAAKLIGRWPSGVPLVASPEGDVAGGAPDNDFGYTGPDPNGLRCPLGAHIRRANPRDSLAPGDPAARALANRHRILRRGRPYGSRLDDPLSDDGTERGLMFVALNASIERQFEFVQHTWCGNPKFHGLRDEADPLLAGHGRGNGSFTMQDPRVRRRVAGLRSFVRTRGGAYFFLPGLAALRRLAVPPA